MKSGKQRTSKVEAKFAHSAKNCKQDKEGGQIAPFELRTSGKPAFRLTTLGGKK